MSRFKPRTPKWPWRDFLTADEARVIAAEEHAKAELKRLRAERAAITGKAIQRAKAASGNALRRA